MFWATKLVDFYQIDQKFGPFLRKFGDFELETSGHTGFVVAAGRDMAGLLGPKFSLIRSHYIVAVGLVASIWLVLYFN